MYFEVENTPERIRKARKAKVKEPDVVEDIPRLLLAPFSRPPQIFFENVPVGLTAEKHLEILNPSKQAKMITLADSPPPGLVLQIPDQWLTVEPETCYTISVLWTPVQPTALRQTIRFTNNSRERFDVIVIMKTAAVDKPKKSKKVSPGKIKKKSFRKSPVTIHRKKAEIIYTTEVKKCYNIVQRSYTQKTHFMADKENINHNNSMESISEKCPFTSINSIDSIDFDADMFSNGKRTSNIKYIACETFDKTNNSPLNEKALRPSNKANIDTTSDIFDNLTFTPLKTLQSKDKLGKGPKVVISINSESEFDDSIDLKADKENQTHSILCINTSQTNKWLTNNQPRTLDYQHIEMPNKVNKIIPNTSSPKDLHSPNFSINTEFSRISDLSFFPQRHSTDKKAMPKIFLNNETQDLLDDQMNSDTYTKESPHNVYRMDAQNQWAFIQPRPTIDVKQPKICRQSLFKELQQPKDNGKYNRDFRVNEENVRKPFYETDAWHNELRADIHSPPRSITPPLQSIPEESVPLYETRVLDKSDRQMTTFTINRTFDNPGRNSISNRNSWSKKNTITDADVWKMPVSVAKKTKNANGRSEIEKISNVTYDGNKSTASTMSLTLTKDVYSQSLTVDPFLSKTYFYNEQAVGKFEEEFKRWLNCILTPPADLDSNIEQKIDVGKAWIENRNKEIPAAPTKEQVCSNYHNSHRLESLRRSARALLRSPEISQVLHKLYAQIDKKLIAVRSDRNLHLDVGLQKAILKVLLSYNPLWLRIGLETIYGIVLPLKSNSDIEGITVFIIKRMFKNPFLKNKHTKSNAPNMLLPAYMEAIKKFTLRKFFTLVFFLDQAKQKKLIPHDPCLFCRNAMCKESRDVIINFTKEMIAGIGDITKHLRPLGFVVVHKQSYIDEYKYAVHNIAVDLRDGVRITKVMEIILMKNNLLNQLRTPAISRLQKIHNVQVAFNALKDTNFTIDGDIVACDIADGNREKTLSFLWQIIHVFRAPLFEKAANVLQIWWRSKLAVILEKRKVEEAKKARLNRAATVIQSWWRRIQFLRYQEYRRICAIKLQAHVRALIARRKVKEIRAQRKREAEEKKQNDAATVMQIWWRRKLQVIYAKRLLVALRQEKINNAASAIQSWWRRVQYLRYLEYRWRCAIRLQAFARGLIAKRKVCEMKAQREREATERKRNNAAVVLQAAYRGFIARSKLKSIKNAVQIIQIWWRRHLQMVAAKQLLEKLRIERQNRSAAAIQAWWRRVRYLRYLEHRWRCAIKLQAHARALIARRQVRELKAQRRREAEERKINNAATVIQTAYKGYLARSKFNAIKKAIQTIQIWWRCQLQIAAAKKRLDELRKEKRNHAASLIQSWWHRVQYLRYLEYRWRCAIKLQAHARALIAKRKVRELREQREREQYERRRNVAATIIQAHYRGHVQRLQFTVLKHSTIVIQKCWRSRVQIIQAKELLEKLRIEKRNCAASRIQLWWRRVKYLRYLEYRWRCAVKLQALARSLIAKRQVRELKAKRKQEEEERMRQYAAVKIQAIYRGYCERAKLYKIIKTTKLVQTWWRSKLQVIEAKRLLAELRRLKQERAASAIQSWWRRVQYLRYLEYRWRCAIKLQAHARALIAKRKVCELRAQRLREIEEKKRNSAALLIQAAYRGHLVRTEINKLNKATCTIQSWWRVKLQLILARRLWEKETRAAIVIQTWWRRIQYLRYLEYRWRCAIKVQAFARALIAKRKVREIRAQRQREAEELRRNNAAIVIQAVYRGYVARKKINALKKSTCLIQSWWREKLQLIQARRLWEKETCAAIVIQTWWRRLQYLRYLEYRWRCVIKVQAFARALIAKRKVREIRAQRQREAEELRRNNAAIVIQAVYRGYVARNKINALKKSTCLIQSWWREKLQLILARRLWEKETSAAIVIQTWWRRLQYLRYLEYRWRCAIKVQAFARALIAKRKVRELRAQREREALAKQVEAATKIQAVYRGHLVRTRMVSDKRVADLRRRWREGALQSTQESLKERNDHVMFVLTNMADIASVIAAVRSLETLTEVYPMMYDFSAPLVAESVFGCIQVTNRSISSIEILKSAGAVLVNLARYRVTGPHIYKREHIARIIKCMSRFTSDVQLLQILCTYLWVFSKYSGIKEDLSEYLRIPENHKIMNNIKKNIERMKRMENRSYKTKYLPHPHQEHLLPDIHPHYGIIRPGRPSYFNDALFAIQCLFKTFDL